MKTTRILSVAALATLLAACNSIPDRNSNLERTRGHLQSAQQDSKVASLAPEELKRAAESFSAAEKAHAKSEPEGDVNHLAYVAEQRVTIARETATNRAAQAVVAGASAERDKMRLAMRTEEADSAKVQLAVSQQANAQQSSELADAQATAQLGNARIEDLERQLSDLGAKKTDKGMVVTLGGVLFYTGEARLLPKAKNDMNKLAAFFKRNPQRTATVEGNTDDVGDEQANKVLSQNRADSVMAALIELGVAADHLRTSANGEGKPVATNTTAAGRQMNRRVEIIFAPEHNVVSAN
jgi:outer membrane protein OmpA-like peptidoglycan-associated protein